MRTSRSSAAAALAVTLLGLAITITPTSHDWGDVAVNASVRVDFTLGGIANRDSALAIVTGTNASDWILENDRCWANTVDTIPCGFSIAFWPRSLGPKTATLVVRDYHGNRVTAQLKGKGVQAICEMKVVFCNYAHLYDGVFSWQEGLAGGKSSTSIVMEAKIDGLKVACNGTETLSDEGGTRVLASTGSGLVAVEFKQSETMGRVYNITVACPTPGDADTPSQPAELGHFEQQSYDQNKTTPIRPIVPGVDLVGSSSYPNPANDALNGVTGNVVVKWNLKHK